MKVDSSRSKRVLLTRPPGSNEALAKALKEAGYEVEVLPLLAIEPLPERAQHKHLVMNIDHYQHVICTSQHAARLLVEALDQYWPQLPTGINWYALGNTSASHLQRQGLSVICPQAGNTSEDLLKINELLNIRQQKILIVKGRGGRDHLANQLVARGAKVDSLELYQRVAIAHPATTLHRLLLTWRADIAVLMSSETLSRFSALQSQCSTIEASSDLPPLKVIVPSERVAMAAEATGYQALIARSADHREIVATIQQALAD